MTDLIPTTALGDTTAHVETIGNLTFSEVTDYALVSIAQRKDVDIREGFKALGFDTVPDIAQIAMGDRKSVWWMAPGQWMFTAPRTKASSWAETVKDAFGTTASITDQSHGWCRFDITGETIHDFFERLCPLDTRNMAIDTAQRTGIHHMTCYVLYDKHGWSVIGPRSSAASLHDALTSVARGL